MKPTPEDLAASHRLSTTRSASERAECPTGDAFAAAASGELSAAERNRFADHLGRCAECAEEMRLLAPIAKWAERRKLLAFRPRLAVRVAALAAAVAIASGAAVVLSRRTTAPVSVERGVPSLVANVRPPDGAVVPEAPDVLSWPADREATSYRVSLLDFGSSASA